MANTIIKENLLQRELIRQLDKNRVISAWANRKYQKQLTQQGDTVTVQEFPRLRGQRGGTAGAEITEQDWAINSHQLTVNQVLQDNRPIKDIEKVQSNIDLHGQVAGQFSYAISQSHENHIALKAVLGASSANEVNAGTPTTVTAGNSYGIVESLRVKLANQDVYDSCALFVNPQTSSYIRQSGIFDGYVMGLMERRKGMIPTMNGLQGELSGFAIYETNNLPFRQSLTLDTVPTADDTLTVTLYDIETETSTDIVFKFVASPTDPGDIDIKGSAALQQAAVIAAITGGAGAGTDYIEVSAANRKLLTEYEVSLGTFASDVGLFTANRQITLSETFTAATNIFGDAGLVLFAVDKEAINFVDQMTKLKTTDAENGFFSRVLYESVYQAEVLGRNSRRIATLDVAV
jgi:hypothetical protein